MWIMHYGTLTIIELPVQRTCENLVVEPSNNEMWGQEEAVRTQGPCTILAR